MSSPKILEYNDVNVIQPLFIWWGQFGFKLYKKVCISTLGEAGAATWNATVKTSLAKDERPGHAVVRLRAAAETLRGRSGGPKC